MYSFRIDFVVYPIQGAGQEVFPSEIACPTSRGHSCRRNLITTMSSIDQISIQVGEKRFLQDSLVCLRSGWFFDINTIYYFVYPTYYVVLSSRVQLTTNFSMLLLMSFAMEKQASNG